MQIVPIGPAGPAALWPAVGVDGTTVTVGDGPTIALDLAAHQRETAHALPIWCAGPGAAGGYSLARPPEPCAYVAVIELPPRRYVAVEVPSGGEAGEPETAWVPQPQPIDMNAVRLRLWPLSTLAQEV